MTETTKHVDYLKRLTADLRRTRRRVAELEDKLSEPVALVGMGCRYPGGADSWRMPETSTPAFSALVPTRPWRWIRSSG